MVASTFTYELMIRFIMCHLNEKYEMNW